MAAPA